MVASSRMSSLEEYMSQLAAPQLWSLSLLLFCHVQSHALVLLSSVRPTENAVGDQRSTCWYGARWWQHVNRRQKAAREIGG